MHFIMQVRPRRNARSTDIPDRLPLLYIFAPRNPVGLQVRIAGVKSVLVLDDNIISPSGIKFYGNHLSVSGCNDGVS